MKLYFNYSTLVIIFNVLAAAYSLDCWECGPLTSASQEKCLTSTKILGTKKRCTNTQPACSTISSEMANGTTIFERSCKRLIDYLDGQIGKTFSGSFCYEKKISTYTRKLGKECICVENLCNSDVDRNETADVMLDLLKKIDSNVYSLKNNSSPSSMLKKPLYFIQCMILFLSIHILTFTSAHPYSNL